MSKSKVILIIMRKKSEIPAYAGMKDKTKGMKIPAF
jgi:hypothetical protein